MSVVESDSATVACSSKTITIRLFDNKQTLAIGIVNSVFTSTLKYINYYGWWFLALLKCWRLGKEYTILKRNVRFEKPGSDEYSDEVEKKYFVVLKEDVEKPIYAEDDSKT